MNTKKEITCPCTCYECFLLGNTMPDWPRRKECQKLEEKLKMIMEDEGGIAVDQVKIVSLAL